VLPRSPAIEDTYAKSWHKEKDSRPGSDLELVKNSRSGTEWRDLLWHPM
jgi:hypothetical protein